MSRLRVANAPLSQGAFEMTVGTSFLVPPDDDVAGAVDVAAALVREAPAWV